MPTATLIIEEELIIPLTSNIIHGVFPRVPLLSITIIVMVHPPSEMTAVVATREYRRIRTPIIRNAILLRWVTANILLLLNRLSEIILHRKLLQNLFRSSYPNSSSSRSRIFQSFRIRTVAIVNKRSHHRNYPSRIRIRRAKCIIVKPKSNHRRKLNRLKCRHHKVNPILIIVSRKM